MAPLSLIFLSVPARTVGALSPLAEGGAVRSAPLVSSANAEDAVSASNPAASAKIFLIARSLSSQDVSRLAHARKAGAATALGRRFTGEASSSKAGRDARAPRQHRTFRRERAAARDPRRESRPSLAPDRSRIWRPPPPPANCRSHWLRCGPCRGTDRCPG